jgi:hypothetical protein
MTEVRNMEVDEMYSVLDVKRILDWMGQVGESVVEITGEVRPCV